MRNRNARFEEVLIWKYALSCYHQLRMIPGQISEHYRLLDTDDQISRFGRREHAFQGQSGVGPRMMLG
jgi:hypothetical protein